MFKSVKHWRERAETAEAALETCKEQLETAEALLNGLTIRLEDMSRLVSIETVGRTLTLTFIRNGRVHKINAYGDMSINVPALKRELLERE